MISTLLLANNAIAATGSKTYQYVPEAGSNITISAISIWIPDNFTGTVVDPIYGIHQLYGDGPVPADVFGGSFWIAQYFDPDGFSYRNPDLGIRFFEPKHNLIFWGSENSWEFVDGKVVFWSLGVAGFKEGKYISLNDSIGGTWKFIGNTIPIPEPSTYALLAVGLGIISYKRKNRV